MISRNHAAITAFLIAATALGAFFSCSSEVCKDHRDCAAGQACVEGKCIDEGGGTIPRDASPRDAAPDAMPDAYVDASTDDALPSDAGALDSSPDATTDAAPSDSGEDAGGLDSGILPNDGLIWAGFRGNFILGTLIDRSQARYSVTTQSFSYGQEGTCELRVARKISGTTAGFDLARIEVQTSEAGAAAVTLLPKGDGVYCADPLNNCVQESTLFYRANESTFHLFPPDGTPPRPLAEQIATVPNPPLGPFISLPVEGAIINIPSAVSIAWTPSVGADAGVGEPLVVELFDALREVLLTCVTRGDGAFLLPLEATQAWRAQNPGGARLEIRYQKDVTLTVPPVGLPVTFRTSRGRFHDVILN